MMRRIKMLTTRRGAISNLQQLTFEAGMVYTVPADCPEDVAAVFLRERWAIEVKDLAPTVETGGMTPAPRRGPGRPAKGKR